ncbi:hypothetical protein HanIR_Chr05g0225751 [Helianthus annuus]|nr:hypothetical protein HanIR_Chr05g0225751 [Helianthus annuus]
MGFLKINLVSQTYNCIKFVGNFFTYIFEIKYLLYSFLPSTYFKCETYLHTILFGSKQPLSYAYVPFKV